VFIRSRALAGLGHLNVETVLEGAQLLELLACLELPGGSCAGAQRAPVR
jgi:hypothetical protein